MVFRPSLPPRAGYFEVVDEYGNHVYKPTKAADAFKTIAKQEMTAKNATLVEEVLHLELPQVANNLSLIKFTAPCDCASVTGGLYIDGTTYTIVDSLGNTVTGVGGAWCEDAMISVILDKENSRAFIQNSVPLASSVVVSSESAAAFGMQNASLEDVINGIVMLSGTLPPTVETVGTIGQCYWDSQTKLLYKCTKIDDSGYTWTTIAGGVPKFTQGPIMITESQTIDLTQYGLSVGDQVNVVVVGGGGGGGGNSKVSGGHAGESSHYNDSYNDVGSGTGGGGYGAGGGGGTGIYSSSTYYGAGGGGGSGYLASGTVTLTGTTIEVTVGKGGYGGNTTENASTSGTSGGASSFGNYLTVEGGEGGEGGTGNSNYNKAYGGESGAGGHNGGNGGDMYASGAYTYRGGGGGGGGGWVIESATNSFGTDGTEGADGSSSNGIGGIGGVGGTSGYAGSGDGIVLFWY